MFELKLSTYQSNHPKLAIVRIVCSQTQLQIGTLYAFDMCRRHVLNNANAMIAIQIDIESLLLAFSYQMHPLLTDDCVRTNACFIV